MYVATMTSPVAIMGGARSRGLGDATSVARNVQVGGSIAAGAAVAAISSAGSVLGVTAATLVPIVGPALAAATMLVQHLVANSGCGQSCIVTSQWANQAEDGLRQNLEAYKALSTPRTKGQQAVALANFDTIWQQLRETCGQPGTGDAGKRCISDRQRGACTWRDQGECWDWFKGYRDPIAKDAVVPDPDITSSVSGAVEDLASVFGGASSSVLPILIIGGLVLLAVKS